MGDFTSTYMSRRDTAQQKFEQLLFDEENKQASLQQVCTKTLARYDAEIHWYDRHADRRRIGSVVVRSTAVVLGTLSILFINVRAFYIILLFTQSSAANNRQSFNGVVSHI